MNTTKKAIEVIEQMYCVLLMTNVKEVKKVIHTANIHDEVREMVLKIIGDTKEHGY
jgi:hypothetical protein